VIERVISGEGDTNKLVQKEPAGDSGSKF
jgi:hypothetical protein